MIGSLRHRGPDGLGFHLSGPIGMAHARLSVIDLETGDQPITNEDRSIWVVFNGEIFNFVELRATLKKAGHVFRTASDTEAIVHAYEEFGDDFVHHLNGQFAIALWDERRQRLLLVRDRAGIRPLYYSATKSRLAFASEVKAILAGDDESARLDPKGLLQVFTFWSTVGDRTAFAGIKNLPPGHMLICERGRQSLRRYWSWRIAPRRQARNLTLGEAAEHLRALLIDAIRLQLRADVPVGAYLSGGLDSSGIVALIRRQADVQLQTFSVAFSDLEFDESEYQQRMALHLGTKHTTIRCTPRDIGEIFPRMIRHAETPVVRTGPAPLMLLSGLVRDAGLKVVLTGEGADEIFAGYDLFKEAAVRRFWARQPTSNWRPALFERLYPYLKHSPVAHRSFAASFFGRQLQDTASPFYGHMARWATTRRLANMLSKDLRAELATYHVLDELDELLPSDFDRWDGLARDQYIESQTLLSGYLLSSQGDRVSMANSVEGRVPYLDHRIVEFANQLPPGLKLRGLQEKIVLRHALRPVLPPDILSRSKRPYRAPDCASFFVDGTALDYVTHQFSHERLRQAGIFDPDAATQLFEKCRSGRAIGFADNMAFVGVLSTMILEEQFTQRQLSAGTG